jgi:hypothetical protein
MESCQHKCIVTTLATVRFNRGSIKSSHLVAVRHTVSCLDSGYILGQYISNEHNLLYKSWTAA